MHYPFEKSGLARPQTCLACLNLAPTPRDRDVHIPGATLASGEPITVLTSCSERPITAWAVFQRHPNRCEPLICPAFRAARFQPAPSSPVKTSPVERSTRRHIARAFAANNAGGAESALVLVALSGGGKRSAASTFASCAIWDGEDGFGLPGQRQSSLRSLGLPTKKALRLHCCIFLSGQ